MRKILLLAALLITCTISAQQRMSLTDLSEFRPQAGNWQIVGNVAMSRNMDIHSTPATAGKKKKSRKGPEPPKAVSYSEGTGILLNYNDDVKKDHLLTTWEHGDIELELEVMIPKGSNSGIYLQGRYEIQLLDSWGVQNPSFSDIGGIYRNWESEPGKILKGIPPMSNPSRAPGLWQSMKILFKAPRFDENGNKISNARFVYVDLNGVRIHTNREVPLPTGGRIENNEVEKGPLMIQGDHGPVAFRNISYRLFVDKKIEVRDLRFDAYQGVFETPNDLMSASPVDSGSVQEIDVRIAPNEDNYGLAFSGSITVPQDDRYTFSLGFGGGVSFVLDGEELLFQRSKGWRGFKTASKQLAAGTYKFTLYNYKSAGWIAPRLGLYIEGSNIFQKAFHAYDSYPETTNVRAPIFVDVEAEPRLLRAFTFFAGDGPKLSHTIGVGTPEGVHFIYDLNTANLIAMWRGEFINASPMWHSRGDGSFRPRGSVVWTFLNQPLAQLTNPQEAFPDSRTESFVPKGYLLDEATRMPVFRHEYKGIKVENSVSLDASGKYLVRKLVFDGKLDGTNWYLKLAEGAVSESGDGAFVIGQREYYINMLLGPQPITRTVNGQTELIVPVDGTEIEYEIIW